MSLTHSDAVGKMLGDLQEYAQQVGDLLTQSQEAGTSLRELEEKVLQFLLAMGHNIVDTYVQMQGNGDLGPTVETSEGVPLQRSEEPQARRLKTIFGEHQFHQFVYSTGSHRKIDLRPIDARLSLSSRQWSYLLEEFAQMFCVESAFALSAQHLSTVFGGRFSVDTLESISQSMGSQAKEYLDHLPVPPPDQEGELLVASSDGKGVPLVRPDAPKVKAFETQKLRPGNRRMATLGAVYSVDRHVRSPESVVSALFRDEVQEPRLKRPAVKFKHVTAHLAGTCTCEGQPPLETTGPIEAACWIESQVKVRRQPFQKLLLLLDGDHHLWSTLVCHLPDDVIQILDILHVSTYVWEAAKVLCGSESERERFTRSRLLLILQGQVRSVIRGLRQMATLRNLRGNALKTITQVCNYFESHAQRMRYDEYLCEGYPIATGVIEGACRHLVKDRMERSGMRWTLEGAKAMLNVRAIHQTSYLKQFHQARIQAEQATLHPHRALIEDYTPLASLAC